MPPLSVETDTIRGNDAIAIARRRARYGRKSWIVWRDKTERVYAAPCTPEAVKSAMLAMGTQGTFTKYQRGSSSGMIITWSIGAMWLRCARAGHFYHFE